MMELKMDKKWKEIDFLTLNNITSKDFTEKLEKEFPFQIKKIQKHNLYILTIIFKNLFSILCIVKIKLIKTKSLIIGNYFYGKKRE